MHFYSAVEYLSLRIILTRHSYIFNHKTLLHFTAERNDEKR